MKSARLGTALCACLAACGAEPAPPDSATPSERIAFYRAQIEKHPRLYPAFAQLGEAWLDRARASHDPEDLRQAELALRRSLDIQESYEALRGMAALSNFRHRFEEGLRWASRAAEALPEDPVPVALQVEAWIGLGEADRAQQVLTAAGGDPESFYRAISRSRILLERGDHDAAAELLRQAADRALVERVPELAVWAFVRAAGVHLDHGDPEGAMPLLDRAAAIDAGDRELAIHRAELAAAGGQPARALEIYEELLKAGSDPGLHAAAAAAARAIGDGAAIERHFAAAELLLRAALEAGEVFPLGDLARLYRQEGRTAEALELAKRNLEFVRDRGTRAEVAEWEAELQGR